MGTFERKMPKFHLMSVKPRGVKPKLLHGSGSAEEKTWVGRSVLVSAHKPVETTNWNGFPSGVRLPTELKSFAVQD